MSKPQKVYKDPIRNATATVSGNKVVINDPMKGRREVSLDAFNKMRKS